MGVFSHDASNVFFAAGIAVLPAVFWFWFYFVYLTRSAPRFQRLFLKLFALGFFSVLPAYIIERIALAVFGRFSDFFVSAEIIDSNARFFGVTPSLFAFALTSFLLVAPIEEGAKYIGIRKFLFRSMTFSRVIDMIRGGIAVGLGFATAENILYFSTFGAGSPEFFQVFVLRFFLSTFAHTLYSAMMGYWLGFAKFHALYQRKFLRNAFWVPVALHGFFNFFLFAGIGYYAVVIVIAVAVMLLGWLAERANFQKFVAAEEARKILLPLLAGRHEVEGLLYLGDLTYDQIRKLSFCPFCLATKDLPDQERCTNCNAQLRQQGTTSNSR